MQGSLSGFSLRYQGSAGERFGVHEVPTDVWPSEEDRVTMLLVNLDGSFCSSHVRTRG